MNLRVRNVTGAEVSACYKVVSISSRTGRDSAIAVSGIGTNFASAFNRAEDEEIDLP